MRPAVANTTRTTGMSGADAASTWAALNAVARREAFIPDVIWIRDGDIFRSLSKQDDPDGWRAAVAADEPVVTQVDLGATPSGRTGTFPSSSCSQPSIVAEMLDALDVGSGQKVLEIGTGTGWNAALLVARVRPGGHVISVEIDARIAQQARDALAATGCHVLVVTADGEEGWPEQAPYDRIIATAAVRDRIPAAWLDQLRPGGRLVTPWGTDWSNGVMLRLDKDVDGSSLGRFSGDLAFMRLRRHRRDLSGFQPTAKQIGAADRSTTECRGADLNRILNPAKGQFAIGARLRHCTLLVEWDKFGERHHVIELDDGETGSWARLDADLTNPAPFTVDQLGPRQLWNELETAYDWWHDHGEPAMDRFGLRATGDGQQWLFLDTPDDIVRTL